MNEKVHAEGEAPRVDRLARFGLTSQHAERLVRFYHQAFQCREIARGRRSGAEFEQLMGIGGGALQITLALGDSIIEVLEFDRPGAPYVQDLVPFDNEFQHFAIVVEDMNGAYERLSGVNGWTPISTAGPQQLPASCGAVTAFKFRDPDGHPLELIHLSKPRQPAHWHRSSANLFLGIDHSAVSSSNSAVSVAFYRGIGLHVAEHSFNQGIAQQLLDGVVNPRLDVIALAALAPTPHVELLCYRDVTQRRSRSICSNDISATRLIFQRAMSAGAEAQDAETRMLDPDGHHLLIRAQP